VIGEVVTVAFFFLVIALTAVLFFGWVVFVIVRALLGGIVALFSPRPGRINGGGRMTMAAASTTRCLTRGCGAMNPSHARFCRRCGHGLPAMQRVQVRRAAVW
jgi:ribosomal protein L40E